MPIDRVFVMDKRNYTEMLYQVDISDVLQYLSYFLFFKYNFNFSSDDVIYTKIDRLFFIVRFRNPVKYAMCQYKGVIVTPINRNNVFELY